MKILIQKDTKDIVALNTLLCFKSIHSSISIWELGPLSRAAFFFVCCQPRMDRPFVSEIGNFTASFFPSLHAHFYLHIL